METNQPLDNDFAVGLEISSLARMFLKETAKWAKFLAILGFIVVGFMVLLAFFAGSILSSLPGGEIYSVIPASTFVVPYLIAAALVFFPNLYLFRFATKTKLALLDDNQEFLDSAFENLKSHYKFYGILMIILLAFYGIILLIVLSVGAGALM